MVPEGSEASLTLRDEDCAVPLGPHFHCKNTCNATNSTYIQYFFFVLLIKWVLHCRYSTHSNLDLGGRGGQRC